MLNTSDQEKNNNTAIDMHSNRLSANSGTPLLSSDSATNMTGAGVKSKVGKTYVSNMPHCNNFLRYVVVFGVFFIISELFFARNIANGLTGVLVSFGNVLSPGQEKPFEDKLTSSIQLGIFALFGLICIVGCLFDIITFLLQKCCCPEDSLAALESKLESRFAALESGLGGEERGHDFRDSRVNQHNFFPLADAPGRENANDKQPEPQQAQTSCKHSAAKAPELRY